MALSRPPEPTANEQHPATPGPERFGAMLAALRQQRGLAQKEVAHRVGLTVEHLCRVERGHRPPLRRHYLERVIEVLRLAPAEASRLLAGGRDRLRELDFRDETPWVIPGLEEWYLRHHNGLDPVRGLLDILASRRRPTLVCCDSWAWAYLCGTVQPDLVLPPPLTMGPLDRERLSLWLGSLCHLEGDCSPLFRQTNSGKFILPPAEPPGDREELECSDFLGRLASFSRGNPGVAWALWHDSLGGAGVEDHVAATANRVRTIWIKPWQDLEMPVLPQRNRSRLAMALHALLLHNGVATGILPELLPNLAHVVRQDLHDLRAAGLVDREHDVWRVTAIAYPVVRAILEGEDYRFIAD